MNKLKSIEDKNKQLLQVIKDQGGKQLEQLKNIDKSKTLKIIDKISKKNNEANKLLLKFKKIDNTLENAVLVCTKTDSTPYNFNLIQDGLFRDCSRMDGGPKICHTYHTTMKLGTTIPYLREIQKMYKSRDTSLESYWHQHFFTKNQQILLHQEMHI